MKPELTNPVGRTNAFVEVQNVVPGADAEEAFMKVGRAKQRTDLLLGHASPDQPDVNRRNEQSFLERGLCRARKKRRRLIHGYRGLLDARKLGFDVTVFAAVHLSSQAEADLRAFEEFVRAEPLVRECWMLSGEVDFILKCVAPDMATFQDFVTHLTAAPHVRNVRTSLVLHNSKYEAAVPLEVKGRR